MLKEEYIETIRIKGKEVDVGLDDYGQCYFFEYKDDNGKLQEICCGSYNPDYKREIADYFGVKVEDFDYNVKRKF